MLSQMFKIQMARIVTKANMKV